LGAGDNTWPFTAGTRLCSVELINSGAAISNPESFYHNYPNIRGAQLLSNPFLVPDGAVFEARGIEFVPNFSPSTAVDITVQILSSGENNTVPTTDGSNSTHYSISASPSGDYYYNGIFEEPFNISSGTHFLMVAFLSSADGFEAFPFEEEFYVSFSNINFTVGSHYPFSPPHNASTSWQQFLGYRLCVWLNGTLIFLNSSVPDNGGGGGGGGGGGDQDPTDYAVKYELDVSLDNFSAPAFIKELASGLNISSSYLHVYLAQTVNSSSVNSNVYFYISGSNSKLMQQALLITNTSTARSLGLVGSPSQVLLNSICPSSSSTSQLASTLIYLLSDITALLI